MYAIIDKNINLFELCNSYIERCNTLEGINNANEKIYNLCADYLLSKNAPKKLESLLIVFFSN